MASKDASLNDDPNDEFRNLVFFNGCDLRLTISNKVLLLYSNLRI